MWEAREAEKDSGPSEDTFSRSEEVSLMTWDSIEQTCTTPMLKGDRNGVQWASMEICCLLGSC